MASNAGWFNQHIISVDRCFVNFVWAKFKYNQMIKHAIHTFTQQEILVVPGNSPIDHFRMTMPTSNHTILQNKRMRRCGVPPPPPPIIFEKLKLPQQIIYRRKENLSESPNHLKYRENILISRFNEHFSRNSRNLSHFWKFEKISNS